MTNHPASLVLYLVCFGWLTMYLGKKWYKSQDAVEFIGFFVSASLSLWAVYELKERVTELICL